MTSDDFADASLSVFAGVSVLIATPAEDGTSHPGGIEFIAALGWRGVVYGAADGLLLSAFPILRVFAAVRDTRLRRRAGGVVAVGAIAMAASLAMTAVYHAGYSDFRSDKMRKPVTGDLVWSVPTLATLNPIGAPVPTSACTLAQSCTTTTPICSSRLTEARKQARPATNKPSRVAG